MYMVFTSEWGEIQTPMTSHRPKIEGANCTQSQTSRELAGQRKISFNFFKTCISIPGLSSSSMRSQLHCPLKLPPKTPPLLPGLNPPTGVVEIPPIPALLPANKMESSDFPALSPRKIKAVPVVWAPKTLPRTEDVVSVRDSRNSTQQRRHD